MSTTNRTCVVCSRPYHACKNCEDAAKMGQYRWRNSCDTPECFQVLLVINDFYYNKISKEDARNLLDNLLDDSMLPYDPNAKILIDEIYKQDDVIEKSITDENKETESNEMISIPESDESKYIEKCEDNI